MPYAAAYDEKSAAVVNKAASTAIIIPTVPCLGTILRDIFSLCFDETSTCGVRTAELTYLSSPSFQSRFFDWKRTQQQTPQIQCHHRTRYTRGDNNAYFGGSWKRA